MNPDEALKLVDNAVSLLQADRTTHLRLQAAIAKLGQVVEACKKPEPVKPLKT